ncbi:HNH endonuclease, partial [Mycolicibacterium duvalii]|nr:HNH endonuclease [Mycolicibacterium duvalii]
PGSALLFPTLCTPTGTLWSNGPPPTPTPDQRRGAMMPRRRLTRAQAHTRYLTVLRRLNGEGLTKPGNTPPF